MVGTLELRTTSTGEPLIEPEEKAEQVKEKGAAQPVRIAKQIAASGQSASSSSTVAAMVSGFDRSKVQDFVTSESCLTNSIPFGFIC